jgi:hypothetical protein
VNGSNLSTNGSSGANWNFLECEQYYEEDVPVTTTNGGTNVFEWILSNPTYVSSIAIGCAVVLGLAIFYYMWKTITSNLNPEKINTATKSTGAAAPK